MALSLETIRNGIVTSIFGRRLGLGANHDLRGSVGLVEPTSDLNWDATGTTIVNYGWTRIISSANGGSTNVGGQAFTLQAPTVPGLRKHVYFYGASTSAHVFGLAGSAIVQGGSLTSVGATMFSMFRQNGHVSLIALSTAIWLMLNSRSSGNASSDMYGISFSATVSS